MAKSCWCLVLGVFGSLFFVQCASAQDDSSTVPVSANSNEKVLEDWQRVSGQSGSVSGGEGGATLEWHGEATEEVYNVDTSYDENSGELSGLQEGTFTQTRLLGDLRSVEQDGDVTYGQGGIALTRDRARQTLYSSRIENLQVGRAGVGYQLSAGDVVASFSNIGSSLGLRGIYGAKQINALTIQGYTGTVTDSWEALINRTPINNQPARTRFLRDVAGAKVNYQFDEQWSVFGTAQTYKDRQSSVVDRLANQQIGFSGSTGTAGVNYKTNQANLAFELGTSNKKVDEPGGDDFGDAAMLLDASYAWQTFSVFTGHHNLGANYTSLSSNVISGIRESFVGSNWVITPSLTYGNRIARSDSRLADLLGKVGDITQTDSLINQLSYSVALIPGLNVSVQDMRNWSEFQDINSRNNSTQLSTFYANQHYNGGITVGNARQRFSNTPEFNSNTDSADFNIGRQVQEGELLALPSISGGLRFNAGYQQQRINNGTETTIGTQGVTINVQSKTFGQLAAGFINQDRRQTIERAVLNSKIVNLDWTKIVSDALTLKAYIRNNYLNHGDRLQRVDEKTVGFIADYLW